MASSHIGRYKPGPTHGMSYIAGRINGAYLCPVAGWVHPALKHAVCERAGVAPAADARAPVLRASSAGVLVSPGVAALCLLSGMGERALHVYEACLRESSQLQRTCTGWKFTIVIWQVALHILNVVTSRCWNLT
jgi:hypothetical protein